MGGLVEHWQVAVVAGLGVERSRGLAHKLLLVALGEGRSSAGLKGLPLEKSSGSSSHRPGLLHAFLSESGATSQISRGLAVSFGEAFPGRTQARSCASGLLRFPQTVFPTLLRSVLGSGLTHQLKILLIISERAFFSSMLIATSV